MVLSWTSLSGCQIAPQPWCAHHRRSKARWQRLTSCPSCQMWTRPAVFWRWSLFCRSLHSTLWGFIYPHWANWTNKFEAPNRRPPETVKVHFSPCRFLCATTGRWYSDRVPTAGWWRRCRLTSRPSLMTLQIETASLICRILTCALDALKIAFPSESPKRLKVFFFFQLKDVLPVSDPSSYS